MLGMERNGNQNIADDKTHRKSKNQLPVEGQSFRQHDLRDNRRECCTVKTDIEIFFYRYAVYLCVYDIAHQDRPDVQKVFSEKRKAEHKTSCYDTASVKVGLGEAENPERYDGKAAGIKKSGTDSADNKVVGNQNVGLSDNIFHTLKHLPRCLLSETDEHKIEGDSAHQKISLPVGQDMMEPFYFFLYLFMYGFLKKWDFQYYSPPIPF